MLTGLVILAACTGNSGNTSSSDTDSISTDGMNLKVPFKEVLTGTIGVCTSSDNLELIKPDSGIVNINIGNNRFFGSTDVGDSVEVTFLVVDGHPISSTIVNLTTLLCTWKHHADSTNVNTFIGIQDNHYAHLFDNIGRDEYCNWYLNDGLLILNTLSDSTDHTHSDTLSLLSLTPDTLRIYDGQEEITFVKGK